MGSFMKRFLHMLTPALFLLFAFPCLSGAAPKGSAFSADSELLILWDRPISADESARRLSDISDIFLLTEHFDDFSICKSTGSASSASLLRLLNTSPFVRVAEVNSSTALCALPEVKYSDAQWALHNTGDYTYYINNIPIHRTAVPDIDINLPEAYDSLAAKPTLRPVTVAIIDTGVDIAHPALRNRIWVNPNELPNNGIDDDRNGYIDDVYGWDFYNDDNTVCHYRALDFGMYSANPDDNDNHGTHCAGIIAATEGISGIASGIDIRILPLKIHGGEKSTGSVSDAVKAIKYAQAAGADICNISWGTSVYSEALETVMRESDMLFVVAAGNSGNNNNSSPLYPASYFLDNMISVAYVTQSGELASDSNYGLSTVDIAAPGQDIFSTTVGGEYHYLSGTSMAAPVVSGIAALLYAYGESPYPQNIKEILLQTLKPLESLVGYIRYPGIPDAAQVIAATDSLANDTLAPTLRIETRYRETEFLLTLYTEDLGGSGIRTLRYAQGALDSSYFRKGTIGQSITDSALSLSRAGTYTFYLCDYAGNETTLIHTIEDDSRAPSLSVSYRENVDGTYTVTVNASDKESGIKRLRFLEGYHPDTHFLAAGIDLFPGPSASFIAIADTAYTIYAADYRGNRSLYSIQIASIPVEQLFLNSTERTLQTGETFRLVPLALPFTATDYISYSVNDETLLYVTADGFLTALAPGTAEVTATTSSGVSKTCIIHILPSELIPETLPEFIPEPEQ